MNSLFPRNLFGFVPTKGDSYSIDSPIKNQTMIGVNYKNPPYSIHEKYKTLPPPPRRKFISFVADEES